MDITDTTHISNSYLLNPRANSLPVRDRRNAEMKQTSSLCGPTVTECNLGVSSVPSSSTTISAATALPSVSAPSISVNRRVPTEFLVPVSESESVFGPSVVQPNRVQCSVRSDSGYQLSGHYSLVPSSQNLPGFSSSCQAEIRDVSVYSHSHMPRGEVNPTLSHLPLPTANFSSGPYMSSTAYYPAPGYFSPYTSLRQPKVAYSAPEQNNLGTSVPFSHVAQGSYSMPPTGPQTYGPSYQPVAPSNVAQPHPSPQRRLEFSVPGRFSNFSSFERSSLTREKRTTELFGKWHISFKGDRKMDPEGFLANLTRCKETYELNFDEIIKALPSVLDDDAWQCFRREYQFWKSYEDLVEAFRLQYSFEDVQERLRKELEGRTQGPSESISTYLCKVRDLIDQLKPPLSLHEQLDRVYQKLHPSYRMRFDRKDFETFPELQKLGKKEELRRAQDRAYKPPPSLAESSFPSSAYVPLKTPRSGKVAVMGPLERSEMSLIDAPTMEIAPVSSPPKSTGPKSNGRTGKSASKKSFSKKSDRRSPSRKRSKSEAKTDAKSASRVFVADKSDIGAQSVLTLQCADIVARRMQLQGRASSASPRREASKWRE